MNTYNAGHDTVDHITALVCAAEPRWDPYLVKIVLLGHALQVDGTDLAIAALRCAKSGDFPNPKAIGWRGPHWRGLDTVPPALVAPERCDICGKSEPDCWSQRPGRDDDHIFSPRRQVSA